MTLAFGRREFLGGVAAAGLLGGCKVSKVPGGDSAATGDLAAQLQSIAEQLLAEYPQNATILGIAKGKLAPLAHEWQDQTPAGFAGRREAIGKRLETLRGLDLADLSNVDKLNGAVAVQARRMSWPRKATHSDSAIRWCSIRITGSGTRPMW
jgi:uncharacterized protein (DUF885 family)